MVSVMDYKQRDEKGRFKPGYFAEHKSCKIENCDRLARSQGWCQMHYMRWYHHKDPLYRPNRMRGSAKDRLKNMTDIDEQTGCIVWRGAVDKRGYGRLADDTGWADMAHRLAYKLYVGEIPEGLVIHHKCFNTRCVNTEHLEPATHYENIIEKGKSNASYLNSIKTHCKYGHELTEENIYWSKNSYGYKVRSCKVCHKRRMAEYKDRKRKGLV